MTTTTTREVRFAVKAAGPADGLADGTFRGYASVFGNVDSYGEVVVRGAFSRTLTEWAAKGDPIPVLWGHDMTAPESNIGWVTDAQEDDTGLLVTCQLDEDHANAGTRTAKVYGLLKGRRVTRMSFAYNVRSAEPGTADGLF